MTEASIPLSSSRRKASTAASCAAASPAVHSASVVCPVRSSLIKRDIAYLLRSSCRAIVGSPGACPAGVTASPARSVRSPRWSRYDAAAIERKLAGRLGGRAHLGGANPGEPGFDDSKPKNYVLEMLPYPSGEPHVGHLKCYAVGDAIAHFRRRNGFQVIHPMGYDAFGLPAENNAIKTGEHPRARDRDARSPTFREQFRAGASRSTGRARSRTHEPAYYRWTQWIFLQLFERGLAYRAEAPVQWCPKDATVLANEQVIDGRCERCGTLVEQRSLEQWFFRITDYADRLLADFDAARVLARARRHDAAQLDRPLGGRRGRSSAARSSAIDFPVFTTRPDTLFGATFFVLAPEHPEVERLVAGTAHEERGARLRQRGAPASSTEERGAEDREKTGVPLGRTVTNPVNGEQIPMFVADYVLMEYGTGADHGGARPRPARLRLRQDVRPPIREVVEPRDGEAARGRSLRRALRRRAPGQLGPSSTAHPASEAIGEIIAWLEAEGRDGARSTTACATGCVSRQRYWGRPIPIVYCESCGLVPVPEDQLPVELPEVEDYAPKGRARWPPPRTGSTPSARSAAGPARRETDTMDTFVDSSWYFLRYLDPRNPSGPGTARSPTTGCPSTSTSAASSTRSCT